MREKQNFPVRSGGCSAGLWEEGGTKPFLHIPWLCCLVQTPSRKENGWNGKKPSSRNVGLAFSSPVVLLFSKCFVLAFILFCPAGNSLGAFPLLSFPPVFQHPGVLWVCLFFQVKFPASTSQLLPKPHVQHCGTPDPLGCAGGSGHGVSVGCSWTGAWDSIWGLFSPGRSPRLEDIHALWS